MIGGFDDELQAADRLARWREHESWLAGAERERDRAGIIFDSRAEAPLSISAGDLRAARREGIIDDDAFAAMSDFWRRCLGA
jgi:hypothetical protein